jgi:hypothetical protein
MAKIMLKVDGNKSGDPEPSPPTRIPLPNYSDPESRLRYAQTFTQKYGPLMSGRGDTPLRINEIPAWGKGKAKDLAIAASQKLGLDPAVLYSSAMEEGMSGIYPHVFKGREKDGLLVQSSGNKDYPVSGYINFGLDNFADAFPGLVKKGYLPPDFQNQFMKSREINEKKMPVNSANFKNPESALTAKAAMMRASRDDIDEFASKNKIPLSPKARDFFTLIHYNAGSGSAQQMLQSYNSKGYLKGDTFLNKQPDASWGGPYENVIRRLKMAEALRNEGYFDDGQPGQPQQETAPKVMLQVRK